MEVLSLAKDVVVIENKLTVVKDGRSFGRCRKWHEPSQTFRVCLGNREYHLAKLIYAAFSDLSIEDISRIHYKDKNRKNLSFKNLVAVK